MALISSHLSYIFIVTFLFFLIPHSSAGHYLKLPLLHKSHYPPTSPESLSSDNRRLSTLFSAIGKRSHAQLPLHSAASFGSGQYLVSLHLGTPPQRLLLVADTGSDLTWVSCSACRRECRPRAAAFFPRHSATFSPHHCFDRTCTTLVPHSKKAPHCNHTRLHSTCRYEYAYSDGSVTSGFFSRETTAFNTSAGKLLKFQHFSFGCGFSNSGPSISGPSFNGADGVMGLGRGPISFSSQLGRQFGHKFSYCLMDYTLSPPPTSYLLIGGGGGSATAKAKLSYTPLLKNPLSPTFYYIAIDSVIVNDTKLPISPSVWAIDEFGNGGTVVDSGTTITFLAEPAYKTILAVFKRLVKLPRLAEPIPGFDLCVNVSGEGSSGTSFPKLSFQLVGGSVFSPPPRNYFIVTAEDVKCLALQPVTSVAGFSVIGNLMQQGYTFEFDKDRSRLGFTRCGCAVP